MVSSFCLLLSFFVLRCRLCGVCSSLSRLLFYLQVLFFFLLRLSFIYFFFKIEAFLILLLCRVNHSSFLPFLSFLSPLVQFMCLGQRHPSHGLCHLPSFYISICALFLFPFPFYSLILSSFFFSLPFLSSCFILPILSSRWFHRQVLALACISHRMKQRETKKKWENVTRTNEFKTPPNFKRLHKKNACQYRKEQERFLFVEFVLFRTRCLSIQCKRFSYV